MKEEWYEQKQRTQKYSKELSRGHLTAKKSQVKERRKQQQQKKLGSGETCL